MTSNKLKKIALAGAGVITALTLSARGVISAETLQLAAVQLEALNSTSPINATAFSPALASNGFPWVLFVGGILVIGVLVLLVKAIKTPS